MDCPYCHSDVPDRRFCISCGAMLSYSAGPACAHCGHGLKKHHHFCTFCGSDAQIRGAKASADGSIPWRDGSPLFALFLSLIFPGAGQAWNGQLGKAAGILLTAPFVVPWLFGCYDAYETARVRGMRGGVGFLLLHLWLVLNAVLIIAMAATLLGVGGLQ